MYIKTYMYMQLCTIDSLSSIEFRLLQIGSMIVKRLCCVKV